tara:strand:- start:1736 stop:1879 length:144 start_codon:yes stop_codon:yes gene_type:complete
VAPAVEAVAEDQVLLQVLVHKVVMVDQVWWLLKKLQQQDQEQLVFFH